MTCICQELQAIDSRFILAERAYFGRTLREGPEPFETEWPEGAEVDRLSDERWEIEECTIESGDEEAIERVRCRRERDGEE